MTLVAASVKARQRVRRKNVMAQVGSSKNIDMTKGEPVRLVLTFSAPLVVGNLLQQVYSMVDAAIVGNFVGVNALAAVGCTSWVVWLLLAVCRDCATAFCIVASQRIGAKNYHVFKIVVANAMMISVIFTVLVTGILVLSIDSILLLMNVPENIMVDAKTYLFIYICATPFIVLYNTAGAMLRAAGNSRVSLYAMVSSTVINIGLDLLFVVVMNLGVWGAATATLIAQVIAAGIVLVGIWGHEPYHTLAEHRRFDSSTLREVFALCLPMFWSSMVIAAGGLYVQKSINSLGSGFTAGVAAGNKLFSLLEAIIMAIQAGTCIFVGQNLGAGMISRIRSGLRRVVLATVLLTCFLTAAVWLFCNPLVAAFLSKGEQVIYEIALITGCRYTKIITAGMLFMTPMYLYRATIQTLGHANYPMVAGVFQLIARIFTVVVLARYWGEYAYYVADILAWIVTLPIVVIPYVYYIKRLP